MFIYKEAFVEERLFTKQSNSSECLFINKQFRGVDCLQINIRAGLIVYKEAFGVDDCLQRSI